MRTPPLILLLDDEDEFLEIASLKLRGKGFETVATNNGRDAIAKAEELLPDLVLSDIYMAPGPSGWEVALELKHNPKTREIKLVFFTSLRDPWIDIPQEARKAIMAELNGTVFLSKIDDVEVLPEKTRPFAKHMKKTIVLNGSDLTIEDVYAVAYDVGVSVDVSPAALKEVAKSQKFLEEEFDKKIIYGVNTGFGPMASHIVGQHELIELQKNLIHGHAMGMGNSLPEAYALAAMVVRLNTLAKGNSGVSPELIRQLKLFINRRIIPVIPEHGAVGTSGDLVQLAHIALALIGGGEVFYDGKRQPTSALLKRLRIAPYVLRPKEGLSLINGTSMMAAIASLMCVEARRLMSISIETGALSLESVHAFTDSFAKDLHAVRPHRGQILIARTLEGLLASSKLLRSREKFQKSFKITDATHKIPESVQEVYSLRCIPQILGPIFDILAKVSAEVAIEINSVTDNPVINVRTKTFLHGGNFHGDYIAAGMDQLKASLVKLTMLSERRINFFLNQNINHFFPPFMNLKKPGLTMGLQGLQFVATSTTAQSQTFAFPQHVHSIPTNGDNQDIVSMGTDAALLTARVIENAFIVLSIELITLAQAVDFLGEKNKYSQASRQLFADVRKVFPAIIEDRETAKGLEEVLHYAKGSRILGLPW